MQYRHIGSYEYIKTIGRGTFGIALLVRDTENKEYIIKQIDISEMNEKERMDTITEVQVLSKLASHPFVVRYRAAFMEDSYLCIVMDYCRGGELHKAIKERKKRKERYTEAEIRRVLTQLLLALKHLHDNHVVHRDIKTPNIFIDVDGRVRLGDFGLAKALQNSAHFAKTFCGTPGFMAPELIKNEGYSYPVDIWALGCVTYELMNFMLPFKGDSLPQIMKNVVKEQAAELPKIYSTELRSMCMSMLQKNQKKRPTAAQLIHTRYIQEELLLMTKEKRKINSKDHD